MGKNAEKQFKKHDVIVVDGRPALVTRVGGDGTTSDTSTVNYSFIEADGNLGHSHYFRDWEAESKGVKFIDFAEVRAVVDLPKDWKENAHAYEMKSKEKALAERQRMGEWEPETHPSYGFVRVSRVSGHSALFGSPFKHQHFMTLSIGRSTRERSFGRDWHFGGLTHGLVEIALSEAQWAHMVSSVGMGGGVPATLRYVGGERMEDCPEQEEVERFHDDIERDAKAAMKFMNAAIEKMQALADDKAPSKEKRKEVLAELVRAQKSMIDSAPFMVKQLHERMDTVVHAAKTEVEAYVHSTIIESGIQKLAEVNKKGSEAPFTFPEPKAEPKLIEGSAEVKKDKKP
jgi:hypothetical protein